MHDMPQDFDTIAAHAGSHIRVGDTISTVGPIDPSTTFTYDAIEEVHAALTPGGGGFAYARNANPTVVALETVAAELEGAEAAVAFGSGMAALHGALVGLGIRRGDTVVAASDLYGVTRTLLHDLEAFGVTTLFVDAQDLESVERALSSRRAKVLLFETIANPLLKVSDVRALAALSTQYDTISVVDNTFATPVLIRPITLGVDVVVHSATKYIAGHGDVTAGLVLGTSTRMAGVRSARTAMGGVLSPFEAWLAMRGIKTLAIRVQRQSDTADEIARWLETQSWVERVYYPGLETVRDHGVAAGQFHHLFGGMVSFDLRGGRDQVLHFLDELQLITPGTSLGDVESLILYPPLTSHRMLSDGELQLLGIRQGLLRLSVGLETSRDLESDLAQAAKAVGLSVRQAVAPPV
jgi:cystathionine beta-lyase/cystathionine gamma-synthase